jgi:hypothetical protein
MHEWCEVPTNTYLDHRYPNWLLAEEFGDVVFVPARGVVLVHRERAEHIARELGIVARDAKVFAPPPRLQPAPLPRPRAVAPLHRVPVAPISSHAPSRWSDVRGWAGLAAGAAVFVTALVVPLDDPALVVALMIAVRGGRVILGLGP